MTNRTRTWTLTLVAGLLGAGDWFLAPLPADDNPLPKPALTVGNAAVSAVLREVDVDGKKERHLFLDLKGEGAGNLKLTLMITPPFNPMSRMVQRPRKAWEKDIAVDTAKSRSIDLGAFPEVKGSPLATLKASIEGKEAVVAIEGLPKPILLDLGPEPVRREEKPLRFQM